MAQDETTQETTSCVACASSKVKHWFEKRGHDRDWRISRCGKCGTGFVSNRPDAAYLAEFYASYDDYHGVSQAAREDDQTRLEEVLEQERLHPNPTIDAKRIASRSRNFARGKAFLDIGSGNGFFTQGALAEGFEVTCIEPSAPQRRVCELMNPVKVHDTFIDQAWVDDNAESFDVILMSQVLEHVGDLEEMLGWFHKLLKPQGVVSIAVPHFGSLVSMVQGKGDMFVTPPDHLNYFSKRGLRMLFERLGFAELETTSVSRFDSRRIKAKLKLPILRELGALGLKATLKVSDMLGKGMILNAYFRKKAE